MENASGLYTELILAVDEIYDEKLRTLGELIKFIICYRIRFYDSEYLEDAISYIGAYYKKFLDEDNIQHNFYEMVLDYFESFDFITDITDQEFLDNLAQEILRLDDIAVMEILHYVEFTNHLNDILMGGVLTSTNYMFMNYPERITKRDQERMLRLVLDQKNKGIN